MPRRTTTEIQFGLVDVSAKEDSALAVSDKQPFSNVEQLEGEEIEYKKYASMEWNRWRLDGTFDIRPGTMGSAGIGWWSASMSGGDGRFASPPTLTVSFSKNHSSIGVTLYFYYADWASEVNVKWYSGNTLLAEKAAHPNGAVYPIMQAVENYNRLVIAFLATNYPRRYLHLTKIDYGVIRYFTGERELMAASCHEEINPLSEEVTVNTLSFTVHSQEAEFSILNPQGIYQFLQQRQKLDLYEYIGGNKRYLGSYYLNEWAGKDENTFEMEAMDSVGIMSGTSFYGGMYAEITAKALLESILSDAGFVVPVSGRIMLDLDPALENVKLTGWLPISSHREAIQQVAFALGAVADTSRTDEVKVYRVHTAPSETIPRSRKFAGQSVELQGFVTGVEVSEHTYTPGSQTETVFESVLPAGQNKVTFREPVFTFTVAGAAVIESHVNYAVVNVASEQKVTVTGKKYVDNVRLVGVYMQGLPAAQKQNVLKVEEATLVGRPNAAFVAQWVYQWHQNRVRQNFTFLQEGEQVGEKYSVETLYGKTKSGLMVSLDTDLSGGFTAKAVVIGE